MAGAIRLLQPSEEITEEEPFSRRLDSLLEAADARPDQPVGVAGPGALDLMCALWRRDFQRVEAARRCTCGCADEMCQLLLVSGSEPMAIVATVEATGSLLRPGGRLAVFAPSLKSEEERQRLRNLLAHRGYRYRTGVAGPWVVATKPDVEDLHSLR